MQLGKYHSIAHQNTHITHFIIPVRQNYVPGLLDILLYYNIL